MIDLLIGKSIWMKILHIKVNEMVKLERVIRIFSKLIRKFL